MTHLFFNLTEVSSPLERILEPTMHIFVVFGIIPPSDAFCKYVIKNVLMHVVLWKSPIFILFSHSFGDRSKVLSMCEPEWKPKMIASYLKQFAEFRQQPPTLCNCLCGLNIHWSVEINHEVASYNMEKQISMRTLILGQEIVHNKEWDLQHSH